MHTGLFPWLDPEQLLDSVGGPWALVVVCAIIFAETGLLIGFFLPGDTLLLVSGLLSHGEHNIFHLNVWIVGAAIGVAAFIGGEVGYLIGRKAGPAIFERRESGLFSRANVERTNAFFDRFGPITVVLARFVPVVRTFAPIAAGVAKMSWHRYSVYNLIGAVVWGIGMTMLGYLVGFIPPVAHLITEYIDLVLIAVVVFTAAAIALHFFMEKRKARRAAEAAPAAAVVADETPEV